MHLYYRALPHYTPDFYQYAHHICFLSIFSYLHSTFRCLSFLFLPLHCSPFFIVLNSAFPFPCPLPALSSLYNLLKVCSLFSHLYLFPGCESSFYPSPPALSAIFCLLELKWYSRYNLPEKLRTSFKSIVSTKGMESASKRAKWLFQSLSWTNKCSSHWQLEEFSIWVKLFPICHQSLFGVGVLL